MSQIPETPWLFPEEHHALVEGLLEFGLIKFDNSRSLPLKSGGLTDVYINLRDARNDPAALEYLSGAFAMPLQRLRLTPGLDRFVEVPDSVSCFAGPLAIRTDLPYLTIRQQAKAGRATDAKVIGQSCPGDRVVIIDDVITDGASKIVPYRECRRLGLDCLGLVVLVDRQQGWRQNLMGQAVDLNVWPGLTLHDVRRQLIRGLGVMRRCDPAVENANRLIVALDGRSWDDLLPLVEQLRPSGCILKVNDLLVTEGIERLLPDLAVYGRVMVDLKCHDIPNTVSNVCSRLAVSSPLAGPNCWPWAVTVHASGGPAMVEAARYGLGALSTKVLAVTVLTSIDPATCEEIYSRQPLEQVLKLAEAAWKGGADGFVCSPAEVRQLRQAYPRATLVTPGIRSADAAADDQKRIATPEEAVKNGSDFLVMGREILGAPDPAAKAAGIQARIAAAVADRAEG